MSEMNNYALRIDGPLLRNQRRLLLKVMDATFRGTPYIPRVDDDNELLEGLMALLDEIADQAHDHYGIDCLLVEELGEGGADGG